MLRLIKDAPGYAVTDDGRVWSYKGDDLDGHELKTRARGPYRMVTLSVDGKPLYRLVHRLVLEGFVGPCPEGCEARHLNGDGADNRLDNLQWGTPAENAADQAQHGTRPRKERHGSAKLTEAQVVEIRRRAANGDLHRVIADDFPVSRRMVGKIVAGKAW